MGWDEDDWIRDPQVATDRYLRREDRPAPRPLDPEQMFDDETKTGDS